MRLSDFFKPETFIGAVILWIVTAIIGFIFYVLFSPSIDRYLSAPNVRLEGVKLFHIYDEHTNVPAGFPKTTTHSLAVIFKVKNLAPTEATAHIAMIKGCVKFANPLAVDAHLPEEEQVGRDGVNIEEAIEKSRNAVQRINVTGLVRNDSVKVSGYGDSYVGTIFNFATQGAHVGVLGSVSLQGECSKIITSQQNPSISEIFASGKTKPIGHSLRPEFANGQLVISLLIGDEELKVNGEQTKEVSFLLAKRWDKLDLAAMYNNPNTDYPPTNLKARKDHCRSRNTSWATFFFCCK